MPYQFRQTGAEIQDILDQVGVNTTDIAQNAQDISTLNSNLTQLSNVLNPTAISYGTRNTAVATGGTVWYVQVGKMVFGGISDLTCSTAQSTHGTVVFTGLPPAKSNTLMIVAQMGTAPTVARLIITNNGTIQIHYATLAAGNAQYYGMFHYLAA